MEVWSLYVTILLIGLVNGRNIKNIDNDECDEHCQCKDSNDESGTKFLDCRELDLTSVPVIRTGGELVQTIDLSYNNLHALYNKSFTLYPNLKQLTLSSNGITYIDIEAFSGLERLRKLDLSHNDLTFIDSNIFVENRNLETVSLQGNRLHHWPTGSPLLHAESLLSLDLSYCHIAHLSADSFSGVSRLRTLDLSYNSLQRLSLRTLSDLSSLRLAGNPWECGCDLYYLLKWASSNSKLDSDLEIGKTIICYLENQQTTQQDMSEVCTFDIVNFKNINGSTTETQKDNNFISSNNDYNENSKESNISNFSIEIQIIEHSFSNKTDEHKENNLKILNDRNGKVSLNKTEYENIHTLNDTTESLSLQNKTSSPFVRNVTPTTIPSKTPFAFNEEETNRVYLNQQTIFTFLILATMLGVAVFISLLAVNYVTKKFLTPATHMPHRALSNQPLLQSPNLGSSNSLYEDPYKNYDKIQI